MARWERILRNDLETKTNLGKTPTELIASEVRMLRLKKIMTKFYEIGNLTLRQKLRSNLRPGEKLTVKIVRCQHQPGLQPRLN